MIMPCVFHIVFFGRHRMARLGAGGRLAILVAVVNLSIATVGNADEIRSAEEILQALGAKKAAATQDIGADAEFTARGIRPTPRDSSDPAVQSIDLNIHFASNSARIESRSYGQIREIATAFRQLDFGGNQLFLIGHTDSRGSAEYNQQLSTRRARAVRKSLIFEHGLSAARLVAEGKGEYQLLVRPERSSADYAKNRRVELRVLRPDPR